MALTPRALLLLSAQRAFLETSPDERALSRAWQRQVEEARAEQSLIVLVQWERPDSGPQGAAQLPGFTAGADGAQPGARPPEAFSREWTLHPDFRAEAGDLLIRTTSPDAFEGSHPDLDAELRARAVRELRILALDAQVSPTLHSAQARGYEVTRLAVSELEEGQTSEAPR